MKGKYTAMQVSKFMVNYANNDLYSPISNLQLQKFLYFLWIEYYKKYKEYLFSDTFGAWQFGPVISDVYDEFCSYGGYPITKKFSESKICDKDKSFIEEFVDNYNEITPYELVEMSHHSGGAWDIIFNGDGASSGNHKSIPYKLIIEKECEARD